MSVGQLLRTRRLERGLEVRDIAAETKIPARFLNAIEDDQHEKLPALPFAVGFVRNYAKMLGLQPEMVCAQFKAETSRLTPAEQVYFPEPLDESRIPSKLLVLGGIALAVVVVGLWWGWTSFRPAAEPAAESQPELALNMDELNATAAAADGEAANGGTAALDAAASPAGEGEGAAATAGDDSAPRASGNTQLAATAAHEKAEAQAAAAAQVINSGPVIIRALDDSWVRISDGVSGAVKIGIMKAGETYRVPALPNLKLMTGNAGAIEIQVGEITLSSLGNRGEVIRNIDLRPESLRELAKARAGGAQTGTQAAQ